jgi:hypothetical protein
MADQELFYVFLVSSWPALGRLRSFRGQFFGSEFLGGGEGVGGGDFDVGLDADAFRVGLADRVDGKGKGTPIIKWPSMR